MQTLYHSITAEKPGAPKGPRNYARKAGRPTKYRPDARLLTDLYLQSRKDVFDIVDRKWHVRLPSIRGFALYLRVHRDTLYRWAKIHPDYAQALEEISSVQFERLLCGGLAGRYDARLTVRLLMSNHRRRFNRGL